ncbi:MAG: hypothetical protein LBS11_06290 [Oscillospiraceae bacterium]|jgi:hypothetical protein|nr:hypothetical protein [Oscillospiraceae bacterium]
MNTALQKFQLTTKYLMDWSFYQIKNIAARPLNTLTQYLGKATAFIGKNIAKITEWMGIGVKFIASFFAILARAIDGVGVLLGRMPGPIKAVGLAIAAVFALIRAGPIGWIAAGIAGVTLLLDNLFTHLEGGEALFGGFWNACVSGVKKVKTAVDKVALIFKAFWGDILRDFREGDWAKVGSKIVGGLKTAFKRVGNLIKNTIMGEDNTNATWGEVGHKILEGIGNALKAAGGWLKETGSLIWGRIKAGFTNAGSFLKGLFADEDGATWQTIGVSAWTKIKEGVETAFGRVSDWLKTLILGEDYAGATWGEVGQTILTGIQTALATVGATIAGLITGDQTASWVKVGEAVLGGIGEALANAGEFVKGLITGDPNASWIDVGTAILNGIQGAFAGIGNKIKGWILGSGGFGDEVGGEVGEAVEGAIEGAVDGSGTGGAWVDVGARIWGSHR